MVGAILKLLVGADIPWSIRKEYQTAKRDPGGRRPRLAELVSMLKIVIASLSQTFICIDALDECRPEHLSQLLESLSDIVRDSPTARVFLTGRTHLNEVIEKHFDRAIVIPIGPNPNDIRNYVEMRLSRDDEPEATDNDLRKDIEEIIVGKMSDRWVGALTFYHYSWCRMYTY